MVSTDGESPALCVALLGGRGHAELVDSLRAAGAEVQCFEGRESLLPVVEPGRFAAVWTSEDPGGLKLVLEQRLGEQRPVVVQVGLGDALLGDAAISAHPSPVALASMLQMLLRVSAAHTLQAVERRMRIAVHHDLRNPLTALESLAASLGQRELLSPSGRGQLDALQGAARRLLQRLDTLQGDRAEVRMTPLLRAPTAVRAVLHEAVGITGLPQTAITWIPDVDPVVRVDPERFRRVIEHLVANVRRHAEGDGQVDVRVEDGELVVEVTDRGPGFPGTFGRGLEYCRVVVEGHGGRLTHRPRHEGGAVFRVTFPEVVETRQVGAPEPSPAPEAPLNVWFADDEELVRKAVSRLLRHAGYALRTFPDGDSMLRALSEAEEPPEAIVCDAEMPGMHGLDVLREVAKIHPQAARILYTAYWPTTLVVDAFNEGVVHRYVNKGQGSSEIEACLKQVLEQRRAASGSSKDPRRTQFEEMLSGESVTLHVQPLFDAKTGALVAAEALMRSMHPAFRGPLEILDAARAYSREYALQRLLAKVAVEIRAELPRQVDLFVNVDPIILRDPDQLDVAFAPLYPVADTIVLELTERAQLGMDGGWESAVTYLRNVGFRIALDDVGAGYNSLGAVAAVTPEVIKLDISLIAGIHRNAQKAELVKLLADYAERRQIRTVAEGIETAEEEKACRGLGVQLLQGYHLGRPVPLSEMMAKHASKIPASR